MPNTQNPDQGSQATQNQGLNVQLISNFNTDVTHDRFSTDDDLGTAFS